jgi:PAS domain S-box-containing protein
MAAIQALLGAVNHVGYFANDIAKTGLLNYWFFIMVLTLIGITMALINHARDQSNRALQEQKDFLNTILENEPECVKVITLDGKLLQMNQAGLDMLEVESLQALQKYSLGDFVLAEYRADFMNLFKEIRIGNAASLEFQIKGLRGSLRWLDMHATGLRDERGQVNALLGVTRDITERKKAEAALAKKNEELERSNAELQQFAYVASHDLQEPLRMVSSYTQLLARRYKGKLDQDAEDFIGYAVDGANRMHDLINDLLAYSQVGSHAPNFVMTDFNVVLKQTLALLQCSILESAASITGDPLPAVLADTRMMIQLFQNLLSNAIKFHGNLPPRIHISAYQGETEWLFSVKDQGIGIAEDQFERMFVIFQRGHSRAEYPGTGIGLALCKRIIECHGGRIWVESTLGQGATFWFSLPHQHLTAYS